MSCIPCVSEGEGSSIPLDVLDRWTDSLRLVLESRDGRKHFKEFLSSRHLEESEAALEFWERCEVLIGSNAHSGHRHGSHSKHANIGNLRFMKDAKDLVTFAEDKVNFDLAQLQAIYEAIEAGKEDNIKKVFGQAMQSAMELLQDDYHLFRTHLLRQKGKLSSKHR